MFLPTFTKEEPEAQRSKGLCLYNTVCQYCAAQAETKTQRLACCPTLSPTVQQTEAQMSRIHPFPTEHSILKLRFCHFTKEEAEIQIHREGTQ